MDEAALKTWLLKKLKMEDSPDRFNHLWEHLVRKYYVEDVLKDESEPEDLLKAARELIEFAYDVAGRGKKPEGRQEVQTPVEIELSDYEREYAEALALHLAKQAAHRSEVQEFRREKLGGGLLTTDRAKDFLRGELLEVGEDEALVLQASVVELTYLASATPVVRTEGLYPVTRRGAFMPRFRDKGPMGPGEISRWLAEHYPWTPGEALWFVLTGEAPEVRPLRLYYRPEHGVFTLDFMPGISEKTFLRAYRKAQKRVREGDNRPLEEKTLAVLRFVTEQTDDEGNRPTWDEMLERWNVRYPEWQFKYRSSLRKAHVRAVDVLAPSQGRRTSRQLSGS